LNEDDTNKKLTLKFPDVISHVSVE